MNQSQIFSIINIILAIIQFSIAIIAFLKEPKQIKNRMIAISAIVISLINVTLAAQNVFSISERIIPILLIRYSAQLTLPIFVIYFYLLVIQKQQTDENNNFFNWLLNSPYASALTYIAVLFFPFWVIIDYFFIKGSNLILVENVLEIIQESTLSISKLTHGVFYQINFMVQIIIPILIIILSAYYMIQSIRKGQSGNSALHMILFAIAILFSFAIQIAPYTYNISLELLLIIVNILLSASFILIIRGLYEDEEEKELSIIRRFQNLSLKYKFTFLFGILALSAIMLGGLITNATLQQKEISNFNDLSFEKIKRLEYQLSERINTIFVDMAELTRDIPEEEIKIQEALGSLQENYPEMNLLAYVPLSGETITATSFDESSIMLSNENWFSIVEMSHQPYIGYISDDINMLNAGIEIVVPIFSSQNSNIITSYLFANLLFRDMESFQTNEYFTIFSIDEQPIYSTYSFLVENLNNFKYSNASISNNSNSPTNVIINDQIFYEKFNQITFLDQISSPLEGVLSYSVPALEVTNISANILLLIISLVTSIILIQLFVQNTIQNQVLRPLANIIDSYNVKFRSNVFPELKMEAKDEINDLSIKLNDDYAYQQNREDELNKRIHDLTFRLNRRATQLSAFTQIVSNATPSLEDINSMLTKYTEVISEQFDFYHVGIFLLDDNKEYAILQSANSPGGKRMLARGHRLEVGRVGCVGYAASTGRSRIAQDIGSDILYYANPDMPETKSEISIPMIENNSIIGVLDIQSTEVNAFLPDDIDILTSLASQIIFSIRNYETMANAEKNLSELSELYGEKIKDAWNKHIEKQSVQYIYKQTGLADTAELIIDESIFDDPKRIQKEIKLRNQSIGRIQLRKDEFNWSDDEMTLIEEILEQSAQALETARLAEQTRARSAQIELLQIVTATCASSLDQMSILDSVSNDILRELKLENITMLLHDDEQNTINIVIDKSSDNKLSEVLGQKINPQDSNMLMDVSTSQEIRVLYHAKDYFLDPILNTIIKDYESSSILVLVPLITRNVTLGLMVVVINSEDNQIIDEQEATLLEQLASQIASALEISTLFDSELSSRQATTTLLDISRLASSSLAIGEVLTEVAQKTAVETDAYRCSIFQVSPDGKLLIPMLTRLASGASDLAYLRRVQDIFNEPYENIPPLSNFSKGATSILIQLNDAPGLIQQRWMLPYEITFLLIVPIISQGQIVGALVLDSSEQELPFGNSQINLAEAISGILATTIENATLFERAIDRAEREHLVSDITTKMRSSNNPKEILSTAINELRQIYKPDYEAPTGSNQPNPHSKEGKS